MRQLNEQIESFIKAQIVDFESPDKWIKIGHGFYSDVYQANFREKTHAIKVIKTADRTLDDTHQAVDNEAEVLVHLQHENMLTLTGVYLPSDSVIFGDTLDGGDDDDGFSESFSDAVHRVFKNGIIITPFYRNGDIRSYCNDRIKYRGFSEMSFFGAECTIFG